VASGVKGGDLSPWDTSYALSLGNEPSIDVPWLGEYHLVAIFERALSESEVFQNFAAGAREVSSTTPQNLAPAATDDVYSVLKSGTIDTKLEGLRSVLANDSDSDGDALTAALIAPPLNGTLTLNKDGSFVYKHNGSVATTDNFTYEADDGNGETDTAIVTIFVDSGANLPIAEADVYSIGEGLSLTVNAASGVLANDSIPGNLSAIASLVNNSGPSDGTLMLNTDGSLTYQHNGAETKGHSFIYQVLDDKMIYTPRENFNGLDVFEYPGQGTSPTPSKMYVRVIPVNDPPIMNDIPGQTIGQGSNFQTIDLDRYVEDADNADADLTWSYSGNKNLRVTIDGNRIATITSPNAGWKGYELITFTATDSGGLVDQKSAVFRVSPVDTFTVSVRDRNGPISNALVEVDYPGIAQQTTDSNGIAKFILPNTGGTYRYRLTAPGGWFEKTLSSKSKNLGLEIETMGLDTIGGTVKDTLGNVLVGATVYAYQPSDFSSRYRATSDVNGSYSIPLPVGAPQNGWSVLAIRANYEPQVFVNQPIGLLDINLQPKTIINVAEPVITGTTVTLNITATPDITALNQMDIELVSGSGSLGPVTLATNIVSVDYDAGVLEDFTIAIKADTTEDNDPNQGYFASRVYTFVSDLTHVQIDTDTAGTNGKVGLNDNGQICEVEVPPGGVSKRSTILIKKLLKNNQSSSTMGSPSYVYEVTAYDADTGLPLQVDEISRIEITIPLDLKVVKPGDLTKGKYSVNKAGNLFSLEEAGGTVVPASHILQTDYLGDGQVGYVTFWVDSLSVFGVGSNGSTSAGGVSAGGGGGGCFIEALREK
jgi:hypothetical protein